MISIAQLLLSWIGHSFLWVGCINRIHAWAGSRKLIDGITIFCVLAFASMPLGILYFFLDGFFLSDRVFAGERLIATVRSPLERLQTALWPPVSLLSIYLNLCALGGMGLIVRRLLFTRGGNAHGAIRKSQKKLINLAEKSCRPLPTNFLTQIICRIPINETLKLSVEYKQLGIPNLCEEQDGLRIAHISDLHMTGRIGSEFFQLVAAEVNALKPDIIALTGDIIESESCRPWFAESLGILQARYGKYFILGNHDCFVDCNRTRNQLVDMGWTNVGGLSMESQFHGAAALIAGNELPWFSPAADLNHCGATPQPPSVAGVLPKRPLRLLLTHSPDQFPWCCQHDVDLVLAGHTHGGQICIPWLGPIACPSKYGTRYAGGVYQKDNTVMHVTRGISGETPMRWNCPPEIALLELTQG